MFGGELLHKAGWIGAGIGSVNWGIKEVAGKNLLSDTLGLAGSQLSFAYILVGFLGVVSLVHYYEMEVAN